MQEYDIVDVDALNAAFVATIYGDYPFDNLLATIRKCVPNKQMRQWYYEFANEKLDTQFFHEEQPNIGVPIR